jgi:predicted Na+-dependent transporter
MWEQYKKTFLGTQVLILGVALAVMFLNHRPTLAAAFFVTMQIGAAYGALWGSRWKDRIRRARELPGHRG